MNNIALCIPEHLHRKGRASDDIFINEAIYRRFNVVEDIKHWKNDKSLSASIFPVKNDSCNREKYSEKPEDVLYNTREEDDCNHYFEMGILSFNSSIIDGFRQEISQNNVSRIFKLKMEHVPLDYMYPHCEIIVMENGQIIDQNKPKSIKALIRDIILEKVSIIKYPSK